MSGIKKGITAINAIVILLLGVLTIVAILGLFMGIWTPASSGTTLQVATQATCQKINPNFCARGNEMYQTRMPVYNFDANREDGVNEHTPEGNWITSSGDDNLEMLCVNYYGCAMLGGAMENLEQFRECCLVNVCKCPRT